MFTVKNGSLFIEDIYVSFLNNSALLSQLPLPGKTMHIWSSSSKNINCVKIYSPSCFSKHL